jgi:hypothetical protein
MGPASKTAPLPVDDPPSVFVTMAEAQRAKDASVAELVVLRHRARDPLAPDHPIVVVNGQVAWFKVRTWFIKRYTAPTLATVRKVTFCRQAGAKQVDAWHIEAETEKGIFRDAIPTPEFYSSWK